MRLHVLTAVSRPENIPRIAESLTTAALNAPSVDVCWHWRFDTARRHIGGQALKNAMLDEIDDGWVYVLDDDTIMLPNLLERCLDSEKYGLEAFVFNQQRTSGDVLRAAPENIRVGGIDIGQAVMSRRLIGFERIPEDYNGDGMFLVEVLNPPHVLFRDEILSIHNALSGVEVSA